jgi:uncharacterized protein (TIGR02217 family)
VDGCTAFAGATGSISSPACPASRRTTRASAPGDGSRRAFQLVKTYGGSFAPYQRVIDKPVDGSVRIAVNGSELLPAAFTCDATTGLVTLAAAPPAGAAVTAGFRFDVPVRFDTDYLEVDLSAFAAGAIPKIPVVEIRI